MLLVLTAAAVILGTWTSWLVRRARLQKWLYAPTALTTVGVPALAWLTTAHLTKTFDDVAATNASARQATLSHGVSNAMVPTAVALLVVGVWLLAMAIATLWLRRSGRLARPD